MILSMTMFVGLQVSVFPLLSEYRFLHLTETYRSRIVVPRSFVQRFLRACAKHGIGATLGKARCCTFSLSSRDRPPLTLTLI